MFTPTCRTTTRAIRPAAGRARPGGVLAAALVASALTLTGCGLGGDPAPSAASVTTATTAPAPTTPSPATSPSPTELAPSTSSSPVPPARAGGFTFPIRASTSFGRAHHDYPATDIFAACGSTVVAPTDGVISEVSRTDVWVRSVNDGATRGGLSFSMVADHGVRFYGSHLRSIGTNITPGTAVQRGDVIGHVGKTGDAADVACHLHFGISPACGTGDWWTRRGAISPYRYLKAWQDHQNLSPATAVAAWKSAHGCPKNPPKGY